MTSKRVVLYLAGAAAVVAVVIGAAQWRAQADRNGTAATPRTADGKPDLSGYWGRLRIDGPPQTDPLPEGDILGTPEGYSDYITAFEKDSQISQRAQTNRPVYKSEYWEKIRFTDWDHSRKKDPQSHCRPGVPRMGAPQRIVQLPNEVIFFYEEDANHFRTIPTDGRKHHDIVTTVPGWFGDSVGRWEGDTLVIETVALNDQGWICPTGCIRSDQTKVIERVRREGNTLFLDTAVEDPMLLQPWQMDPIKVQLNESPEAILWESVCSERDEVFEGDPYEGR